MMLTENYHAVYVWANLDLTTGSPMNGDSINMEGFHSATFYLLCGALGVADCTLTLNSGATAAALTSALTFNYAWTSAAAAAASADVLASWTSGASVVLTNGTYDNFMLVCEVEAAAMDLANNENWLTASLVDAGGATGNVSCVAILKPRYQSNVHLTALT